VDEVYRKLGGVLPSLELKLGRWDMEFDGVAVELDEYLHFNRYRAVTLECPIYGQLSGFPLAPYREYCAVFEACCLDAGGYGGKWSNKSCERQFGHGSQPTDLSGGGAPRWKQRAFYDFVKDLCPLLVGVSVARVAIWDRLSDERGTRTVKEVLFHPSATGSAALAQLVRERTMSASGVGIRY
jgi:hypothetical protein